MQRQISESDWRVFKKLYAIALERFSQKSLDEVLRAGADKKGSAHERYREVYRLVIRADKRIAAIFDDYYRRSVALLCLRMLMAEKLVTHEEILEFSDEVRTIVAL